MEEFWGWRGDCFKLGIGEFGCGDDGHGAGAKSSSAKGVANGSNIIWIQVVGSEDAPQRWDGRHGLLIEAARLIPRFVDHSLERQEVSSL